MANQLHTHAEFEFIADAPIEVAFPLFGANGERAWAPDWDPMFVWPEEATDRQGMVFNTRHGDRLATWVNTLFDRVANRVQYVYVIPDLVATVITLKLTPSGRATHVAVAYERTALNERANAIVRDMAARDKLAGSEWGEQINDYLKR